MFIITQDSSAVHQTQSIFDTATGLRYTIQVSYKPKELKYISPVGVSVESAHTSSHENSYPGISYCGKEAVGFWQQLVELCAKTETSAGIIQDAIDALAIVNGDNEVINAPPVDVDLEPYFRANYS